MFSNIEAEIFDAHFHLVDSWKRFPDSKVFGDEKYCAVSCSHSVEDFILQEDLCKKVKGKIYNAFGIFPQNPVIENAAFLEKILKEKRICAIGECGFDFWNEEFKINQKKQEEAFIICAELGAKYEVPLIIHNRKALDMMFKYEKLLNRVPEVLFHSFSWGIKEAESILLHKINAFFSFGPRIYKSQKSIDCIRLLPKDRILFETDAPFMCPPDEIYSIINFAKL